MFGKKRMLLLTLILFTVGSLIGALSHTLPVLIAARFVQGTSSGVFPLAYGIVRDEFPKEKAAAAIGLISGTFGIGGGLGLVLSGVIVDNLSLRVDLLDRRGGRPDDSRGDPPLGPGVARSATRRGSTGAAPRCWAWASPRC